MPSKLPLLIALASSFYMTGVIWFVHLVHYPLFARVEAGAFPAYHAEHTRATASVVLIPMVLELASSAWLVARRPEGSSPWLVWVGLALAVATWAITFLSSVPTHNRLASGFDPAVHRALVGSNRVRVVAWTGHSAVMLALVARGLR